MWIQMTVYSNICCISLILNVCKEAGPLLTSSYKHWIALQRNLHSCFSKYFIVIITGRFVFSWSEGADLSVIETLMGINESEFGYIYLE